MEEICCPDVQDRMYRDSISGIYYILIGRK